MLDLNCGSSAFFHEPTLYQLRSSTNSLDFYVICAHWNLSSEPSEHIITTELPLLLPASCFLRCIVLIITFMHAVRLCVTVVVDITAVFQGCVCDVTTFIQQGVGLSGLLPSVWLHCSLHIRVRWRVCRGEFTQHLFS